jgi:CheY-like chemotaxis protein
LAREFRVDHSPRPLRVLLAEDNAVNQIMTVHLLEKMGHSAVVAHDGLEALAIIQQGQFDVVLMDCQMPKMDGYAATRAIRLLEAGRLIPIVAVTANTTKEDRQRCLDAGMDDFLPKPITLKMLSDLFDEIDSKARTALVNPV